MVKEIPILFSTPMVQAILSGQKFQTRRIIKESFNGCLTNGGPHPCPNEPIVFYPGERIVNPQVEGEFFIHESEFVEAHFWCSTMDKIAKCRYGKAGDLLWIRESFGTNLFGDIIFKASTRESDWQPKWKPSIHMKKEWARVWLRNVGVKVEALNSIGPSDAIAEGIERDWDGTHYWYKNYLTEQLMKGYPMVSYQTLWEKINGKGSWEIDPWVWVISFEVLSTTGKP